MGIWFFCLPMPISMSIADLANAEAKVELQCGARMKTTGFSPASMMTGCVTSRGHLSPVGLHFPLCKSEGFGLDQGFLSGSWRNPKYLGTPP